MKKVSIFLLFFYSSFCISQNENNTTPEYLLEKGNDSEFYDNIFSQSLKTEERDEILRKKGIESLYFFDKIITDFPESNCVCEATYNKACIYDDYLNKETAKEIYLSLINSDKKCNLYKRMALRNLASIEIDQKDFELAFKHIEQSREFSRTFTCGNELETDTAQLINLYKKYYQAICEKK